MKTIIVKREPKCWTASFYDQNGTPDTQMVEIFGSHTIPTPFTPLADYDQVKAELQHGNPDANIFPADF